MVPRSLQARLIDPRLLPAGVVGVVCRHRGERIASAGPKRLVEGRELRQYDPRQADAVEDQVVHRQVQPMMVCGEPDQPRAQQGAVANVIGNAGCLGDQLDGAALGLLAAELAEVERRQLERRDPGRRPEPARRSPCRTSCATPRGG